ncbi:MAG: winged helix DNA-binding domain-containing protein [Chloroflexi bacterium]|nr:winged helix DNA-binding domain-containing protein [Chloroflexota bacterium]
MRISMEEALSWGAVSQCLTPPAADSDDRTVESVALAVGGLPAQPNHAPVISLVARIPGFQPGDLAAAQAVPGRKIARIAGPRTGSILSPTVHVPALSRLARATGRAVSEEAIAPLDAAEVTAAVGWIHTAIRGSGAAYPEIRSRAPAALLRHVERGSARALHQETALQQVLMALEARGDLVSTIAPGLNTSEGPYRYVLRSEVTSSPDPSVEDAFAELAAWYVSAFAPVEPRDFASWSGLPEPVCRRAIGAIREPLRPLEIAGLGQNFLAPESFLDRTPLTEPVCAALPWVDGWLQSYRSLERFLQGDLPGAVTPRDLVFVSLGPGIRADQSLAARIGVVGSAREPRFRPEPWRPLSAHESTALQGCLERLEQLFAPQ